MIHPSVAPACRPARFACRSAAALLTVALGSAADASVFNFSSVYSYFGAYVGGLGGLASVGMSGPTGLAGFSGSQSLTNADFLNPSGSGNISMVRSGWNGSSFNLGFDENTSGARSWGAAIRLTFTVTEQTVVTMSGWLMGNGWSFMDYAKLRNTTDSVDVFSLVNRANYFAPAATPVSFNSGDLTLEAGKTYQLEWLTETVRDVGGADQNPIAGFTAFSFGSAGVGAVPLPGAAGLAALGLVGISRRRRR